MRLPKKLMHLFTLRIDLRIGLIFIVDFLPFQQQGLYKVAFYSI